MAALLRDPRSGTQGVLRRALLLAALLVAPPAWGHAVPAGADGPRADRTTASCRTEVAGGALERDGACRASEPDDDCCGHCSLEVGHGPPGLRSATGHGAGAMRAPRTVLRAAVRYRLRTPRGPPVSG